MIRRYTVSARGDDSALPIVTTGSLRAARHVAREADRHWHTVAIHDNDNGCDVPVYPLMAMHDRTIAVVRAWVEGT